VKTFQIKQYKDVSILEIYDGDFLTATIRMTQKEFEQFTQLAAAHVVFVSK
jgi:hypothetical protein